MNKSNTTTCPDKCCTGEANVRNLSETVDGSGSVRAEERAYLERLLLGAGISEPAFVAERLLARFLSLEALFEADFHQLSHCEGSSEPVAHLIRLVVALNKRRMTERVKPGRKYKAAEIEEYLKGLMLGNPIECVYLLAFDKNEKILNTSLISEGTVCASDVLPRRVLDAAVKHKAHSVIIAHNHPGGSVAPSVLDVFVTKHIKSVLASAGIAMKEHYVVAANEVKGLTL